MSTESPVPLINIQIVVEKKAGKKKKKKRNW